MAPSITTDANYLACKCRTLENSLEREFSREFNRVCKRAFEDNSRDNSINRSINRSINPSIDQSIDQSIHQSCDQSINRPSPFLSLWLCCAVLCCGVYSFCIRKVVFARPPCDWPRERKRPPCNTNCTLESRFPAFACVITTINIVSKQI